MGQLQIKKAVKGSRPARIAFSGVAGSGKTILALETAVGLGGKIVVIDTEHESASLYSDRYDFLTIPMGSMPPKPDDYHPRKFVEALDLAEKEGADVIVIDSMSHEWMGVLAHVDRVTAASDARDSFGAGWRSGTPEHDAFKERFMGSKCHIIATMRAKPEYVVEPNKKGKQAPRKIGLAPVQREGMDHEFDIFGEISLDHTVRFSKTRMSELDGQAITMPDRKLGEQIRAWLGSGATPVLTPPTATPAAVALPSAPTMTKEDTRAEYTALETLFGGRDRLLEAIGAPKPKTMKEAISRAKQAHEAALKVDDDIPFDEAPAPEPPKAVPRSPPPGSAPPLKAVPKADQTQHPGANANQSPDAAKTKPANGPQTKPDASEARKTERPYVGLKDLWPTLRRLGVPKDRLAIELVQVYGKAELGALTPEQRDDYLERCRVEAIPKVEDLRKFLGLGRDETQEIAMSFFGEPDPSKLCAKDLGDLLDHLGKTVQMDAAKTPRSATEIAMDVVAEDNNVDVPF